MEAFFSPPERTWHARIWNGVDASPRSARFSLREHPCIAEHKINSSSSSDSPAKYGVNHCFANQRPALSQATWLSLSPEQHRVRVIIIS